MSEPTAVGPPCTVRVDRKRGLHRRSHSNGGGDGDIGALFVSAPATPLLPPGGDQFVSAPLTQQLLSQTQGPLTHYSSASSLNSALASPTSLLTSPHRAPSHESADNTDSDAWKSPTASRATTPVILGRARSHSWSASENGDWFAPLISTSAKFVCADAEPLRNGKAKLEVVTINGESCLQLADGTPVLRAAHVVALSFDVLAETSRVKPEGQVLIVTRNKSLSWAEWCQWLAFVFYVSMVVVVGSGLIGPLAAVGTLSFSLYFRRRLSDYLSDDVGWSVEEQLDALSLVGMGSLLWVVALWITPHIFGVLGATFCAAASAALLFRHHPWLTDHFGLDPTWRMPLLSRPIVILFHESELPTMLAVRAQLFTDVNKAWRDRMLRISIGSYWVETICSGLLFSDIYNSARARYFSYIFFAYVMPVVFSLQVFGLVGPWLWRQQVLFMTLLRADLLVRLANYAAHTLSFPLPAALLVFVEWLAYPITAVRDVVSSVSAWLVPFDEAITYVRIKLASFRLLLQPFELVTDVFGDVLGRITTSVAGPVAFVVRFGTQWAARLSSADRTAARLRENPLFRQLLVSPARVLLQQGPIGDALSQTAQSVPLKMRAADHASGVAACDARD